MARVEEGVENSILGIYLLPEDRRPYGTAQVLENMIASPVNMLARRPRTDLWFRFEGEKGRIKQLDVLRKNVRWKVIVDETGRLEVWKLMNPANPALWVQVDLDNGDTTVPTAYWTTLEDMELFNVNDLILLCNKSVEVRMVGRLETPAPKVTNVIVTGRLPYQDVLYLKVGVIDATASKLAGRGVYVMERIISYVVPSPVGDGAVADKAASAESVANWIETSLNSGSGGVWNGKALWLAALGQQLENVAESLTKDWPEWSNTRTMLVNARTEAEQYRMAQVRELARFTTVGKVAQQTVVNLAFADYNAKLGDYNVADNTWVLAGKPGSGVEWTARNNAWTVMNNAYTTWQTEIAILNAIPEPSPVEYAIAYAAVEANVIMVYENYANLLLSVINGNPGEGSWLANAMGGTVQTALVELTNYLGDAAVYSVEEVMLAGLVAKRIGANVAVWYTDTTKDYVVEILPMSGNAEKAVKITHPTTQDVTALPNYTVEGTIVAVAPDKGALDNSVASYWLKAESILPVKPGTMCEVVWKETNSPYVDNELDRDTMPHVIFMDSTVTSLATSWSLSGNLWAKREKGDERSCPNPSFVGRRIRGVNYFQARLSFISGNNLIMSKTMNVWDFFRSSAVKLLLSDPVDIASSNTEVDVLEHMVAHNGELLLFSRNGQFKVSGDQAATPETVSMRMTGKNDLQISVPPVSAGEVVYFPVSYGGSSGVAQYSTNQAGTQDLAGQITGHVVGLLKGKMEILKASSNLGVIVARSSGMARNELAVCQHFYVGEGKRFSWKIWKLADRNGVSTGEIVDVYIVDERIMAVIKKSLPATGRDEYFEVSWSIVAERRGDWDRLYLDFLTYHDTVYKPYFGKPDFVANSNGDLLQWVWDVSNEEVVVTQTGWTGGRIFVGWAFVSTWVPSRIYRRNTIGEPKINDIMRISRFTLDLVDTYEVWFMNSDKYGKLTSLQRWTNKDWSRWKHGKVQFHWGNSWEWGQPVWSCSNPYGFTVSTVTWQGSFSQVGRTI